jgi:hypothetical protein
MSELLIVCSVIGSATLLAVLIPFFKGEGGQLIDASVNDKPEVLEERKEALLRRWLQDEEAAQRGDLSEREWQHRQRYLTSRYVDTAKRLAWLRSLGFFLLMSLASMAAFSDSGWAQVGVAPRQMWILKPGQDSIYGTWIAAVMNKGVKPEKFRLAVLLPQGVTDFQPREGVVKEDVRLEADGLWIEKMFEPGVNVVTFSFMTQASGGVAKIEARARGDIGELSVMTPSRMLKLASGFFNPGQSEFQEAGIQYDVIVSSKFIMTGDSWAIDISEVPEGRALLWFLGVALGLLLLVGAGLSAWITRPAEAFSK